MHLVADVCVQVIFCFLPTEIIDCYGAMWQGIKRIFVNFKPEIVLLDFETVSRISFLKIFHLAK
jgi:hypothetical protein